jgi:hypothetical protein
MKQLTPTKPTMMAVILQEPADNSAHVGDDEDSVDDDDDEARFSAHDLQQRFPMFFSFSCILEKQLLFKVPLHSVHKTLGILSQVQT